MAEGKIVTFYSFSGAPGRTMALANTAWIMASNGLKVLVVDWDLDSPGLHRYLHPFLDPAKITATPGVTDLVNEYAWAAANTRERSAEWRMQYTQILRFATPVNWRKFPAGGELDFVSAGGQNRDYSSAVASIDWDNFYERLGGGQFFDELRASMKANYDYILIDSPTGLNNIAEICTVHLPDILVDCFTLSDQSVDGAAAVARNLDQRYHNRRVKVLPVAMRVDDTEKVKLDAGRALARWKFDRFPAGMSDDEARHYWASLEIPYKPFYAYEEVLAVFGDTPGSPLSLLAAFERLTEAITDGQITQLPPLAEETRTRYLEAFTRRLLPPPGDIYVSYVPEDRMWADWITAVLTGGGFRVLTAGQGEVAGGNAKQGAMRAAASTSRTIAVVSAAYLGSPQARGVWEAVTVDDPAGSARRLIPVHVGEVRANSPFAERTIVDLTKCDAAQAAEKLLHALDRPSKATGQPAAWVPEEPRYPRTIPAVWNVPTRNAGFTGRNEALERLRDQLSGGKVVVWPVALYGLGGVGKTQVALEYAHRYMADYDIVWWLSAEQSELINPAFASLAEQLGIRTADSIGDTAQSVRESLRRGLPYDRWLLIFDNADEPAELERFIPGGPGHILVTSRNPTWSRMAEPLEINVFARAESLELLQRRVPSLSAEQGDQVAEALGDLPLAVEQAADWLAETGLPAAELVNQLERQFADADYPTPVAATWQQSIDRIRNESPGAARLLELCSFFSPEPISLDLLNSNQMMSALGPYDQRLRAKIMIGQLIRDLARYSLAKVDRGTNSIQVHRLVQAAIRAQLESADDRDAAKHDVHRILAGARPPQGDSDDPGNWAQFERIWPHLGPSEAHVCDDEQTRQLLIDRVRQLWQRGQYEQALEFGSRIEDQWLIRFGPSDPQILQLRMQMANSLRSQGRYREALIVDSELLKSQPAVLTDYHPFPLQAALGLAGDLRGLGRFREALEMDQQTHERWKELFGEDHPCTLSSANNLAVDFRLVGDCFTALALDRETLSRRRLVLGADHPYTLHSAASLARDLREAGDYVASVEALRELRERFLSTLGEDDVDALSAAKSLAVALRKAGRQAEAFELTKDTSDRYARLYALDDPDALACRLNLACDLFAREDLDTAYDMASEVRRVYERSFGAGHPFTLAAANNVASYLRNMGSTGEAIELAEETLRSMEGIFGADHPFTLSCAVNVANCLHDLQQFAAAERQQRDASMRLARVLRPTHPDSLVAASDLAIILRANGQSHEADELKQQVLATLIKVLGEKHPSAAALRSWRLQDRDLEPQPT